MLKIRSRVINFRVTADEFERLKAASEQNGASCLSDFARNALLIAASHPDVLSQYTNGFGPSHETEKLQSLESRLAHLESDLTRLQNALTQRLLSGM
jgi:hypothetical protein